MTRATLLLPLLALLACSRQSVPVQVAVGVPEMISRPLLNQFSSEKDIAVEARRPMKQAPCADCDVFWSADLETAMALLGAGTFGALPDGNYGRPPSMVDPQHRWLATSAVARVIGLPRKKILRGSTIGLHAGARSSVWTEQAASIRKVGGSNPPGRATSFDRAVEG